MIKNIDLCDLMIIQRSIDNQHSILTLCAMQLSALAKEKSDVTIDEAEWIIQTMYCALEEISEDTIKLKELINLNLNREG